MLKKLLRVIFSLGLCVFLTGCFVSNSYTLGELVDSSKSNSYFRKGDRIIYSPNGNWLALGKDDLEDVDVNSFRPISGEYGRDNNHRV